MANIVLHADTLPSNQTFPVTFLADFDSDAKKFVVANKRMKSGARCMDIDLQTNNVKCAYLLPLFTSKLRCLKRFSYEHIYFKHISKNNTHTHTRTCRPTLHSVEQHSRMARRKLKDRQKYNTH